MASRNSPSAARSAPRAEPCEAAHTGAADRPSQTPTPKRGRGRLARFASQLDAIIDGRDDSAPCALARAATMPAAQRLGTAWATLDEHAARGRHDPPAVRVLLPAHALPPVV